MRMKVCQNECLQEGCRVCLDLLALEWSWSSEDVPVRLGMKVLGVELFYKWEEQS